MRKRGVFRRRHHPSARFQHEHVQLAGRRLTHPHGLRLRAASATRSENTPLLRCHFCTNNSSFYQDRLGTNIPGRERSTQKGVMMRFFLQGRHCHALTSVRRPATARLAWSRAGRRRAAGRAARWRRRAPAWRSARRCARPRAATATATPAARTSTRTSRCSPARAAPRGSRGRRSQRDSRPTPTAAKTPSGTALKAASTHSGQDITIDRNL
eukprot:COSAG06_NODE_10676_length_1638_cov_1.437297_1_plen_212_part_00